MTALNHSKMFKGFILTLNERYGKEEASLIWQEATQELDQLLKAHPELDKAQKTFSLPAIALYKVISKAHPDDALPLLRERGTLFGQKMGKIIHAITSFPGVARLIWNNIDAIADRQSNPKKGYERHFPALPEGTVGVDIISCPFYNTCIKLNCPEAAQAICCMDKTMMSYIKNIEYIREHALAEGGECCDYRLQFNKNKK